MKTATIFAAFSFGMLQLLAIASDSIWQRPVSSSVERIGWVLIHSTWQLALVAVLAALVDKRLTLQSAKVRYLAGVIALFTMLAFLCVTWTIVILPDRPQATATVDQLGHQISSHEIKQTEREKRVEAKRELQSVNRKRPTVDEQQSNAVSIRLRDADLSTTKGKGQAFEPSAKTAGEPVSLRLFDILRAIIEPRLRLIVILWLLGIVLCSLRPICGLWTQWRLYRVGLSAVSSDVQKLLANLVNRMGLSRMIRVARTDYADVPMVVGYLRPIILLPATVLTGLTSDQLESLLAHELAHVRRHDWLINTFQVLIETIFFYHPAVWWLSNRIRKERELCCDDIAVIVVGNRATYSRMLLVLEELRHAVPSAVLTNSSSVAATGGDLLYRIRRLMPGSRQAEQGSYGWFSGMFILVVAILLVGLIQTAMNSVRPLVAELIEPNEKNESNALRAQAKDQQPQNGAEKAKDGKSAIGAGPNRFIAQLTPKLSLELIAVTKPEFEEDEEIATQAGDIKRSRIWWKPDGAPLEMAPDAPPGKKLSLRSTSGGDRVREFLIRIDGLEHPYSIWGAMDGSQQFTNQKRNDSKGSALVRMTGRSRWDARTTDLTIALAHEAWGPAQQIDRITKPMNSILVPDEYRTWYDAFNPIGFEAAGSDTQLKYNLSDPYGTMDLHIEAIDFDGKAHESSTVPGSSSILKSQFPIPPSRVSRFEYKFRAFRDFVTFERVSLQPEHAAKVDVTIRTFAQGGLVPRDVEKNDSQSQEARQIKAKHLRIRSELNNRTEIHFTDIPLRDGMAYLGELHNIPIEFDATAGDIDPKVVTLDIGSKNLAEALSLLLYPFELSYVVDDGKLIIASRGEVLRRGADDPVDMKKTFAKLQRFPTVPWESLLRGQIDQTGADTVETLEKALSDKDAIIQRCAAYALYQIVPRAERSIPSLMKAATSNNWLVREDAYFALAAIGKEDLSTLPFLLDAWPKDEVVRDAFDLLINVYDERVYTELEKSFSKASPEFRRSMIQSTYRQPGTAIGLILLGLADADETVHRVGLNAGRQFVRSNEPLSDAFVAAMRPMLKANESYDRLFAASSLLRIPNEFEPSIQVLLQLISDGTIREREQALAEFRYLPATDANETAIQTIERLDELLKSEHGAKRSAAMMALGVLNAQARQMNLDLGWGLSCGGYEWHLSSIAPSPVVGQSVELRLEVKDSDKRKLDPELFPNSMKGVLYLLGPDTKEVTGVQMSFSNKTLPNAKDPYDILAFDAAIDAKRSLFMKPGQYLLQFRGENFGASNVLTIKVGDAEKGESPKDNRKNK